MNLLKDTVLKPHIVYIRLMRNRVVVKHLQSGKQIDRNATKPFSNDRLLICDPSIAEEFTRAIFQELLGVNLLKRSIHILLQPVDDKIKDVTPAENMIYNDFAHYCGGNVARVYQTQEPLTDEQVMLFLKF